MRQAFLATIGMFFLSAPNSAPAPIAADGFDAPPLRLAAASPENGVTLRVMNYNVKGLPWPVIADRSAELATIGDRLKAMRRAGDAPDVVVLQEAFSSDARAIAGRAGYRYVAYGPASGDAAPPFPEAPLPDRYPLRGEGYGAYVSSGLVLMSDHPIVATRRAAFPRTACAGYDCLANKGVLLARIAVPGLAVPVEIMTAHMNSIKSARIPTPHANQAFVRQMAAIDRFVAANADPRLPLIFGGDLNINSNPDRIAALRQSSASWERFQGGATDSAVFAVCGKAYMPCRAAVGFDSITKKKRNNDWQLSFAGSHATIQPVSVAIRFMPDPAGRTLSDHQAVMVDYRLSGTDLPASKLVSKKPEPEREGQSSRALKGEKSVLSS
jgi:endonuclease/exonuclease/phosphatase family metal-dependent hydrolase